MALLEAPCPACGSQIQDNHRLCPRCGFQRPGPDSEPGSEPDSDTGSKIFFWVLVLMVVAGIALAVVQVMSDFTNG